MTSHPPTRRRRPRTARAPLGLLAAAALALLAAAPAAHAAPFVDVTYDLGDSTATSTINLLGLTAEIPPDGTLSGTQTLRYTGSSGTASGLATGSVDLLTFNLDVHATVGTIGYTASGGTGFITVNTSDLHIEFLTLTAGAGKGQLLSGGTITPLGASGIFRVTGYLHCFDGCFAIGVPRTVRYPIVPDTFTAPLPVLTGAVGLSHTIHGTAKSVNFQVRPTAGSLGVGVTGTTILVGREVSRTAVPEPSTLPLLVGGLAALGLAAAAARGRW